MDIMTYAAAVAYTNKKTAGGGSGGTTDYNALINKPSLNGTELVGNQDLSDFGINEYVYIGEAQAIGQPFTISDDIINKIENENCVGIKVSVNGEVMFFANKFKGGSSAYVFTSVVPPTSPMDGDMEYGFVAIDIPEKEAGVGFIELPYLPIPTDNGQLLISMDGKFNLVNEYITIEAELSTENMTEIELSAENVARLEEGTSIIDINAVNLELGLRFNFEMSDITSRTMFSYCDATAVGTQNESLIFVCMVDIKQNKINVIPLKSFNFSVSNGNPSAQNKKIVDVATPTNPTDAATKQYVDDGLAANRQFDLFGLRPNGTATITLPIARDNVLVVFYSVAPDGTVNVANSKAVSVDKGASATKDAFTIAFNADGLSFTLTSTEATNSILGQYYSYNNI